MTRRHFHTPLRQGSRIALGMLIVSMCVMPQLHAQLDNYTEATDAWLSRFSVRLAENYDKALRAYQYDVDDFSPSFHKVHYPVEWRVIVEEGIRADRLDYEYTYQGMPQWTVSTSLLPVAFPFLLNLNVKYRPLREGRLFRLSPGVLLGGNGWIVPSVAGAFTIGLLDEAASDMSIDMYGGSAFAMLYRSLTPQVKLFGGYRFAYGTFRLDIPDAFLNKYSINTLVLGFLEASKDFQITWYLHELIWGIDFLTRYNNEWVFYLGYETQDAALFCKTEYRRGLWTYGLGLHPDNVIALRPYIRFQVDF